MVKIILLRQVKNNLYTLICNNNGWSLLWLEPNIIRSFEATQNWWPIHGAASADSMCRRSPGSGSGWRRRPPKRKNEASSI